MADAGERGDGEIGECLVDEDKNDNRNLVIERG